MILTQKTRFARNGAFTSIRKYHDARAVLINPGSKAEALRKDVDIKFGDPDEAYVMISPEIGSILAGQPFPDGETIEVPLIFSHRSRYFSRGAGPELPRLEIPFNLPRLETSDTTAATSDATLFQFGLFSTIALNGTSCEEFTRLASTTKSQIGETLEQLKDM
ncbi:hypothetical protein B7463_g7091, partial [Scytalidium lignicola]